MPFPDELVSNVSVVAYDPRWPGDFDRVSDELVGALPPSVLSVDHIGSTAVPGLAAKDCIDVQVSVAELAEEGLAAAFGSIGFRRRPEPWNRIEVTAGREWPKLVFAPPIGARSCNVHVRRAGSPTERRNFLFRDFLRADAEARDAWGGFKRRLSATATNIFDYGQIKAPATEVLMMAADEWARRTGWRPPRQPGGSAQEGLRTGLDAVFDPETH